MRQAFIQVAALTARLWLAVFFGFHAIEDMAPEAIGVLAADIGTDHHALDLLASVFFTLVALWLALGIYSRIIAIIGMVVIGAEILLFGNSLLQTPLVLAVLATLVLSIAGGGRLRLHAGGWRLRDCL
ncbi:hypothetical protein [Roseovarius ramblicola]|uniref:DoxX n=1 Tax=Roseovarius ramblicola TaxID=2022336 RepID=A0ABV5I1I6_9RHOB